MLQDALNLWRKEKIFLIEIFNFTKDTKTVKEVADICKKINPKVILRETNDEIPNLGFSLSNKKILKTGFKFLYGLEKY